MKSLRKYLNIFGYFLQEIQFVTVNKLYFLGGKIYFWTTYYINTFFFIQICISMIGIGFFRRWLYRLGKIAVRSLLLWLNIEVLFIDSFLSYVIISHTTFYHLGQIHQFAHIFLRRSFRIKKTIYIYNTVNMEFLF